MKAKIASLACVVALSVAGGASAAVKQPNPHNFRSHPMPHNFIHVPSY